jgi:hypothetical protein
MEKAGNRMNHRAEDAANKIMLAFDSGGLVPLDLHEYAVIDAHCAEHLGESDGEQRREAATELDLV